MSEPAGAEICCPKFEPEVWDGKEFDWKGKRFIRDRVRSFLHIPLNFGLVMRRNSAAIAAAGAWPERLLVLSDENSLWGADVYIEVAKDVPKARMAWISGTFMTRVFEGPFQEMRRWIAEMTRRVEAAGRKVRRMYFFYTTCPKCAKKYGKNYVVIFAQV
jgi:hypothetical protein